MSVFDKFPKSVIQAAQASQAKWGVPTSVTLAQWAIESAYGKSMPFASNNPFGIKAAPDQPFVIAWTREVFKGKSERVEQRFRKFDSLEEAFDAHGKLLATSHYYTRAMHLKADPNEFADALTGVYATDPHYGSALKNEMRTYNLYQFDLKGPAKMPSMPNQPTSGSIPAPAGASIPIVAPAPVPPSPTPSSVVRVYDGDLVEQLLRNETPFIEDLAIAGFHAIPMSSFLQWMISDRVIKDYVDKALVVVEGAMAGTSLDVNVHSNVVAAAINLFTKDLPSTALKYAPMLEGWVRAALGKAGVTVKPA